MIYTNKQKKVIIWKPNNRQLIVSKNSRPYTNGNYNNIDPNDFQSAFSRPRPLKHYRKQLFPYFNSSSKQISLDNVNGPNGSYYTQAEYFFNGCNQGDNTNTITDYILDKPDVCNGNKYDNKCKGGNTNVYYRQGTTVTSKNYYQTTKSYLYNKCKTFEQKSKNGIKIDNNSYKTTNCSNDKCNKTIYKPNNVKFANQGSVTSSTRLLRLKNDTINKNGASFRSAFGSQSSNAGKYKNSIRNESIYFDKDKYSNNNNCSITNQYPQNFRKLKYNNC